MIGEITDEHTRQDIVNAKGLGLDAFALNFDQFAYWSEGTVDRLFNNADALGFGLFFSFDHAAGHLSAPSQYQDYLKKYITRPSYFKYNGRPLVSTFGGESISDADWAAFKSYVGNPLLIPGFYQIATASTVFNGRSNLDGVFSWNSWAYQSQGKVVVPTIDDQAYLTAAHNSGKLFMMGMSPLQFKHYPGISWYRRGEDNLEYRFGQVLAMQPDMLQLQTWNDRGESHYMGNLWPEPATGDASLGWTDGYDHKGYWQILSPFIQAWKRGDTTTANMVPNNGKPIQGTFWHHTLLTTADCSADSVGKPSDIALAEDVVSGVILVAKGRTNLVAVVNVGTKELGKRNLVEGFNKFKFVGLTTGNVHVDVWDGSTFVGSGYGNIAVTNSASMCNYNFQVVAIPS
ncbi:glycoside hydrolase family 71 protein [Amniculicola lignicola CBS 123094]|uniref:Glycoside hydrolase family 71 protein n=1 Tax=Amniculicola lignicola CBS 123094 TaxID=1392246 RepID=A0A6A5W6R3_9PLEO|nr:glycoside hydrolase family 71 protein [Amniculicola lignicola CBS 123094]